MQALFAFSANHEGVKCPAGSRTNVPSAGLKREQLNYIFTVTLFAGKEMARQHI